jgi:hypothetical protein
MEHSETGREGPGKSTGPREIAYLAFAAIPIAIYALAMVIFEAGDFDATKLESELRETAIQISRDAVFLEARARVIWLSTVLLYYVLTAAVIVTGVAALKRSLTPRGFNQALFLWGALSCVGLAHLAYVAGNNGTALGAIFHFPFGILSKSNHFDPTRLAHITMMVSIVNVLAAIAPFAVALGASATLVPFVDADPMRHLHRLSGRMRRLKTLVNMGSALLAAGVLHMQAWLGWPIVFITEPKLAAAMTNWSFALTAFVGIVFSLMIAFLYIPCASVLAKRAEDNLRQLPSDRIDCPVEEWLEKHGFSSAPAKQIPQILAVLAPLLASSTGATLAGFGNSVGN